jgi:hypothetical protein
MNNSMGNIQRVKAVDVSLLDFEDINGFFISLTLKFAGRYLLPVQLPQGSMWVTVCNSCQNGNIN